jgi:hypothetical protein
MILVCCGSLNDIGLCGFINDIGLLWVPTRFGSLVSP